jgi:hypothetical protein
VSVRPIPASAFVDAGALDLADGSRGLSAFERALRSVARVPVGALALGAVSGAFVIGTTSTTGGADDAGSTAVFGERAVADAVGVGVVFALPRATSTAVSVKPSNAATTPAIAVRRVPARRRSVVL